MLSKLAYAAALDQLNELDVTTLPDLACDLLIQGIESESLIALAGETARTEPFELRELLYACLRDQELAVPTRKEAAITHKLELAKQVISGDMEPAEGARRIVSLHGDVEDEFPTEEYVGDGFGVAEIVGLFYSYDDVPFEDQRWEFARIDAAIVAACRGIVANARDVDAAR